MRVVYVRMPPQPDWSPRGLIVRFAGAAAGLFLASRIDPGIDVPDWQSLVAGVAVLGIVNMVVRPIAALFSFCLILLTFGLFLIVINAGMLALTAWASGEIGLGLRVDDFWSAVFGALIISITSMVVSAVAGRPARHR
jgi:putative membrane protein